MTYELHNKVLPDKDFHIFSLTKIFNKQDKLQEPLLNHNQNYIQKWKITVALMVLTDVVSLTDMEN